MLHHRGVSLIEKFSQSVSADAKKKNEPPPLKTKRKTAQAKKSYEVPSFYHFFFSVLSE